MTTNPHFHSVQKTNKQCFHLNITVIWFKTISSGNYSDIVRIKLFSRITSGYRCGNLLRIERALGNSKLVNIWWLLPL